jgi:hypothetical protein
VARIQKIRKLTWEVNSFRNIAGARFVSGVYQKSEKESARQKIKKESALTKNEKVSRRKNGQIDLLCSSLADSFELNSVLITSYLRLKIAEMHICSFGKNT